MERNYKKLYEETKKELDDVKLSSMSSKENILNEIAKCFGESLKEKKSYGEGENKKTYEGLTDFYNGIYNVRKDVLIELLKKLNNFVKDNKKNTKNELGNNDGK